MQSTGFVVLLTAIPMVANARPPGASHPIRLSLEDAIRVVNGTSHRVASERATSTRAEADVVAARSGFFPRIMLTGSYVRTLESEYSGLFDTSSTTGTGTGATASPLDTSSNLPFGNKHAWRGGITASESIWDGGRTAHTVSLARGAERAADLDLRSRRAQAVLDVTDAYYGAQLAARVVEIGEASLALAEQTLENARLGYERGTVAEFDVVRSEVTRDSQRTALIRSRADRDHSFRRLRQLLGIALDHPIELASVTRGADEVAALARSAAGVRESERVAVGQARVNLEMRHSEVGIARAGRWPTFAVIGDYGVVNYPEELAPEGDWRTNWTVGVYASFPLFTGGFVTGSIRSARADERAAAALVLEAQEQAALDEARAISDAEVAEATLAASHRSTSLARRAYEIADVRYRTGVATYLELVDARIAFDRAQIDEARTARDAAVATVRLALLPALPLGTDAAQRALAPSAVPRLVVSPPATPQPGPQGGR